MDNLITFSCLGSVPAIFIAGIAAKIFKKNIALKCILVAAVSTLIFLCFQQYSFICDFSVTFLLASCIFTGFFRRTDEVSIEKSDGEFNTQMNKFDLFFSSFCILIGLLIMLIPYISFNGEKILILCSNAELHEFIFTSTLLYTIAGLIEISYNIFCLCKTIKNRNVLINNTL